MKSVSEIKKKEVQKEVFKLLEIFEEGFINDEMEIVICHPVRPFGLDEDDDVYCNVYFLIENCKTKKDVQCKVLEWWSRDACKAMHGSEIVSEMIQDYIRRGINEYLGTAFTRDDMHEIYNRLGNAIHHDLTLKFIESGFNMEVLK